MGLRQAGDRPGRVADGGPPGSGKYTYRGNHKIQNMGREKPARKLLRFSTENAKLQGQGYAEFKLPAGYTCPGARECQTFSCRDTGKIKDGKHQKIRCYAATLEAGRPLTRNLVWHNLELLQAAGDETGMLELLERSLPWGWRGFRWHGDGDFFSLDYFRAWLKLASLHETQLFYAYTKSLPYWVGELNSGLIPGNVVLTASRGGKFDHLINKHGLREAVVVNHPVEASALGLKLDKDDSLARDPEVRKFAILLHGVQPAGSDAAASISRMRREGIKFSYSRKTNDH